MLPLEQSLVGPRVGVGIDDCEDGEDEDEGVVVMSFDVGLKSISFP